MLNKRKPRLVWVPPRSGNETVAARLMLGPWVLCEISRGGDLGYFVNMRLSISKDAGGHRLVDEVTQRRPTLEKAKEQGERYALAFLKAVGLDAVVAFPDKTVRAPQPPLGPSGIRRLEV